ncbi:MAG: MFS transporter [Bacteroidota bacterium]
MLAIQKRLSNSFYVLLTLPATAMGFALSVQIAALSWILSTKYGLEIEEIGLVWAAGPIAGILGQVIVGVISDNVWFWGGRRRPFMFIGGVLAALMLLALPNIDVISTALGIDGILGVAILVALTLDLAINVSFNPTRSVIADVTPEGQERTKGYTWMQTVSGTFGMLAYLIGTVFDNFALIYFGAALVLFFSVIPPFFITEPRDLNHDGEDDPMDPTAKPDAAVLEDDLEVSASANTKASAGQVLMTIQPLWGFLLYGVYGMVKRVLELEFEHYYFEYFCLAVTVFFVAKALLQRETGKSKSEAGMIGFQKVLAAHSFTWVGVQTMFVYMFAYVQDVMPSFGDDEIGDVINISFLVLNGVAALLPALILEPVTKRIGRVKTHMLCIALMAMGYAGIFFAGDLLFVFGVQSGISPIVFSEKIPLLLYVLMGIVGIGWAATVSLPFAIMSQKVDQARMGLYMGLFNLSVVLPQLVASLGIGEIVGAAADKRIIFLICAGTLAVSAVSWLLVRENEDAAVADAAPAGGGH